MGDQVVGAQNLEAQCFQQVHPAWNLKIYNSIFKSLRSHLGGCGLSAMPKDQK